MSSTEIQGGNLNNVFSSVNQDSLLLNSTDYICVFLHNTNSNIAVSDLRLWVGPTDSSLSMGVACDNVGAIISSSKSFQADQIATRYVVPINVTDFIYPKTQLDALPLPDLLPNYCVAVWLQRITIYSELVGSESVSLILSGITAT